MKNWIRILLVTLTLLSLFFIFSNSLKPSGKVESTKRAVVEAVENTVKAVTGKDFSLDGLSGAFVAKIGHVLEFGAFGLFFSLSLLSFRGLLDSDSFFRISAVCTFVALTDEHLQTLTPGRTSSVTDVLVDLAACITAFAIAYGIGLIRNRKGGRDEGNTSHS